MNYDKGAVKDLVCPLCKSRGTLRPIRLGRRLRVGPWSYALLLFKTHECTACGATFNTQQLVEAQKAA